MFHPDVILYDAGVDPHEKDQLGKLKLTDQGNKLFFLCPLYADTLFRKLFQKYPFNKDMIVHIPYMI